MHDYDGMTSPDWTSPEQLAVMAAEELSNAMDSVGVDFTGCFGDDDGDVSIAFGALADAEALLTLAVRSDDRSGSLYDRATASCVSLTNMSQSGSGVTEEQLEDAMNTGWVWVIHPAMQGKRMGWHARVSLPSADALTMVASLNAYRIGGAA
jgi:hypothetical protein